MSYTTAKLLLYSTTKGVTALSRALYDMETETGTQDLTERVTDYLAALCPL